MESSHNPQIFLTIKTIHLQHPSPEAAWSWPPIDPNPFPLQTCSTHQPEPEPELESKNWSFLLLFIYRLIPRGELAQSSPPTRSTLLATKPPIRTGNGWPRLTGRMKSRRRPRLTCKWVKPWRRHAVIRPHPWRRRILLQRSTRSPVSSTITKAEEQSPASKSWRSSRGPLASSSAARILAHRWALRRLRSKSGWGVWRANG